ncbi:MAG: bifunctional riboflavin kinase/FAD synthetase [Erysipelotrichaceae bacterium]
MRIIQIELGRPIRIDKPLCACIGYFDGIHLGHQALINKTLELSKIHNCDAALITFDPDPRVTVTGIKNIKHLTTMKQRINLAVKYGIRNIIILKFSKEMANLDYEVFEDEILVKCNLIALVCGFDFRYGKNGEGNSLTLKASGKFEVEIIDSVNENNEKISTTRILSELQKGKIEKANKLLGYYYEIQGRIIEGRGKGKTIGFPTANIEPEDEYYLPKQGVYSAYIRLDNIWYKAMVNIGHNPTFNEVDEISLEAHILDFNKDIYGKNISLQFVNYLRDEIKFNSVENLKLQLDQDLMTVRKTLDNYKG